MTSPSDAFELFPDLSDLADDAHDAVLAEFPGCADIGIWLRTVPNSGIQLPEEVWFWGSLQRVARIDYLRNDQDWVVISRRLLECLESLGTFPHAVIPVHIREAAEGQAGTLEGQFYVLVITEATDVLDAGRTEIVRDSDGSVALIRRWAFKSLPEGLPPVFRVPEDESVLLISPAAKKAIEVGGFSGLTIVPQDKIGRL